MEWAAGALVAALSLAWLLGLMDQVVMPLVVLQGVERKVPDLRRLAFEDADSACRAIGVELTPIRRRVEGNMPPATVLDQFPVAGSVVRPGRRVEVVVSARVEFVSCPNLVGQSPRSATLVADSLGLVVGSRNIGYRHSPEFPEGVVMWQAPSAGTRMMPGEEIALTVSLGSQPSSIVAPDLVGRKLDGLTVVLAKYALRLGKVENYPDRATQPGTVISQDPPAGSVMQSGGTVSVRVAVTPKGEVP